MSNTASKAMKSVLKAFMTLSSTELLSLIALTVESYGPINAYCHDLIFIHRSIPNKKPDYIFSINYIRYYVLEISCIYIDLMFTFLSKQIPL